MESKYYTPSLEEFGFGFEYEHRNFYDEPFEVKKFDLKDAYNLKSSYYSFVNGFIKDNKNIYPEQFRVKYLDKKDVESLGFVFDEKYSFENVLSFDKDNLWLQLTNIQGVTRLAIKDTLSDIFLFIGIIKNISELKVLLKQLGINE